ncbi:hypothetical protein EAF04_007359 [Stromatinia cepivora]|nr:hypothetical protein EAF04_007359 [Stromatinia cepivora]
MVLKNSNAGVESMGKHSSSGMCCISSIKNKNKRSSPRRNDMQPNQTRLQYLPHEPTRKQRLIRWVRHLSPHHQLSEMVKPVTKSCPEESKVEVASAKLLARQIPCDDLENRSHSKEWQAASKHISTKSTTTTPGGHNPNSSIEQKVVTNTEEAISNSEQNSAISDCPLINGEGSKITQAPDARPLSTHLETRDDCMMSQTPLCGNTNSKNQLGHPQPIVHSIPQRSCRDKAQSLPADPQRLILPMKIHHRDLSGSITFRKDKRIRFLRDGTKKQKRHRMMTRILKSEIVNLRENEKKLQQQSDKFEGEFTRVVRALQEISFKELKPGNRVATTNGVVRDDIRSINSAIREWSNDAVNKNAQLLIQDTCLGEHSELKKELWQELVKVMVFTETEFPRGLHPEKASKLLLTALLSHNIYWSIFSNPFFFLGDSSSSLNSFYSIGQSCMVAHSHPLLRLTDIGTTEAAHIWRSDTLRLFFPEFKHNHKIKSSRVRMQTCLDKVADSYAEGFAASAARYIFKLDSSEIISKLHKVYRQAANLSYNLWTRRVYLKITTLEGLNKIFDGKDPKTILHTSVTEDNEDKLTRPSYHHSCAPPSRSIRNRTS